MLKPPVFCRSIDGTAVQDCFCRKTMRLYILPTLPKWFYVNNIGALEWSSKSSDMNFIENLWEILVRKIYKDEKQYNTIDDLKNGIRVAWGFNRSSYFNRLCQ